MTELEQFVEEFLTDTSKEIKKLERRGYGRKIVGPVRGRPHDEKLSIDSVAELKLKEMLEESGIKAKVFSEHDEIFKPQAVGEFDVYAVCDPFDGTTLYKNGIPHMWYSAIAFFGKDCKPICAGVSEIMADRIYITKNGKSYVKFLDNEEERELKPSRKKSLNDEIVFASFALKPKRLEGFEKKISPVIKASAKPKSLVYLNGGPSLFAYLAGGNIDAYLIESEPRLEIDSGYQIALNAGCRVSQIKSDGSLEPYNFAPGAQEERVDLLATPNKYLEREISEKIMELGWR